MRDKNFKNLNEQIEIFKYKGLTINNEEYAKNILLRENYFFISGYRHLFMKSEDSKKFINGVTFEEMYSLFLFDRQFRNIIFKNLLIIENNVKSIISYQLSKKYGYKESEYLRNRNFDNSPDKQKQINDLLKKMKRQIRVNGKQHSATSHYITNYGYIPLWVLVKVLSFGIVSEMFSILKLEDRLSIASIYGVDQEVLTNYLPILANYRNLCAHEDLCFNNKMNKKINNTKYHDILNISKDEFDEYECGLNDLFAIVIIMKQILKEEDFILMMNEIGYELDILDGKLEHIEIDKVLKIMGFPLNYKEIVRMN